MTAICGGGASQKLASTPDVIEIGANAIAAFLVPFVGSGTAQLLAPIISGLADINATAFCATDPPADPGLTAADLLDAISMPPSGTAFDSQQKILQWFESRYWYQLCECASVATPAPPVLSNPGPTGQNPGLPDASTQTPCWTTSQYNVVVPQNAGQTQNAVNLTSALLPSLAPTHAYTIPLTFPTAVVAQTIPTGASNFAMAMTPNSSTPAGNVIDVEVGFLNSSGTQVGAIFTEWATSGSSTFTAARPAIPTGAVYWYAYAFTSFDAAEVLIDWSFFCAGTGPGGLTTPCCPPDPLLEGMLQQVLQLLTAILAALPAPIAGYVTNATHAGLSGSGSVALAVGTIAYRVDLTTVPASYGSTMGSPPYFFDLGWVTPAALSEPFAQARVAINGQTAALPAAATEIFYTLNAGVTITIVELAAAP